MADPRRMALRSSSRTATPTSGPGRGPVSDGRSRHRRHHSRSRTHRHEASAAALRLRAETLLAQRSAGRGELGSDPPGVDRDVGDGSGVPVDPAGPALPVGPETLEGRRNPEDVKGPRRPRGSTASGTGLVGGGEGLRESARGLQDERAEPSGHDGDSFLAACGAGVAGPGGERHEAVRAPARQDLRGVGAYAEWQLRARAASLRPDATRAGSTEGTSGDVDPDAARSRAGSAGRLGVESGLPSDARSDALTDPYLDPLLDPRSGSRRASRRDASRDAVVGMGAGVRAGARVGDGEAAGAWRERVGPAVRERLPLWLQSRCGLERRSVAALTVLLVAAAAFAVQHFWVGRPQPVRADPGELHPMHDRPLVPGPELREVYRLAA